MAAITSAVIAAGSLAYGVYSSEKAKSAASKAANAGQVDINALDAQTRQISKQNALDSAALEKQLTPEVSALRTGANQQLLNNIRNPDQSLNKAQGLVNGQLGVPLNTPLLNAAIAKAHSDLALGGNLSQDTQNAATRHALSTAGSVAQGGGLGLGRDLVARDLGLTSQQIEQQRLQNASGLGGQEMQLGTANHQNFIDQVNLLRSLNDQQYAQHLSLAQYAQGIAQPTVGLDPGSVANLSVGNASNRQAGMANMANIQGASAQGYLNAAGQFGGNALMAYNNRVPYNPYQYGGAAVIPQNQNRPGGT